MREDAEKDQACRGLCTMIQTNPEGIGHANVPALMAIASYPTPPDDLRVSFAQVIETFVQDLGQPLSTYLATPDVLAPWGGEERMSHEMGWHPPGNPWFNNLPLRLQQIGYM